LTLITEFEAKSGEEE